MLTLPQLQSSRSLDRPAIAESGFDSNSEILEVLPREAFVRAVTYIMQIHEDKHQWRHGRRKNLKYLRQPWMLIKNDWIGYLKSMREKDRERLINRIEIVNKIQKDVEDRLVFYETTDAELIEPEGFAALKQRIVDDFAESVASIMALTQPEPELQEKATFLGAAAPLSVEDRRFLEALPPSRGYSAFVNGQIRTFVENILGD